MKVSYVSDEEIISALLLNGTIKGTAEAVGLSVRQIHERLSNDTCKALYQSAKADIVRKAIFDLNRHLGEAVENVVSIMQNDEINPAIRLQACQTILSYASKFSERLQNDENTIDKLTDDSLFNII